MYIPIDRDQNPYTPKNEKLAGVLFLPKPPLQLPPPEGRPWPSDCKPTRDLAEACCQAGFTAGYYLSQIVGKIALLTEDLEKDRSRTWQEFLGDNLVAREHYTEFATELETLLHHFNFVLNGKNHLFTFPLNDTYEFKRLTGAGLPIISGTIAFESERVTGVPLRFTLQAWLAGPKRPLATSSICSSFGARSSSSIPWAQGGRGGRRDHVITPPPIRDRGVINPGPAAKK